MKAFATNYLNCDAMVISETASKARYAFYLSAKEAGYNPSLVDINVWRMPDFDNAKTIFGKAEANKPYCAEYMSRF